MDTSLPGPVDYQLWIVNHHSATSSKEVGESLFCHCRTCAPVSKLSCWLPVEARALFDHSTHSSWGCPGFLMRDKASSPAAGFIQNGSLLVGVNISLPHHKDQVLRLNTRAIYVLFEFLFICTHTSSSQAACKRKICPLCHLFFAVTPESQLLHGQHLPTAKYTLRWHQDNLRR